MIHGEPLTVKCSRTLIRMETDVRAVCEHEGSSVTSILMITFEWVCYSEEKETALTI